MRSRVNLVSLPFFDGDTCENKNQKGTWGTDRKLVVALAACSNNSDSGSTPAPTAAPAKIIGTAAIGSALANASVAISDSAGSSPCSEATITTSQLGSFTCTLKSGETAPFFLVVTDPTGNTPPLVSIATSTPPPGTTLVVNVTPLTTAIVAQLNGGDALGVVSNKALYVPATFAAAKANVLAQIQPVVAQIDPTLTNYDPFSTRITAATASSLGNTADLVLDVIKLTKTADGAPALSTVSDPTPVPLATASAPGAVLGAPSTAVSDLAQAAQIAAQAFTACYALPVSQRVALDANQHVTALALECRNTVASSGVPNGAPDFKSNGNSFVESFYHQLTSNLMTGAQFSVPEIMAFYPQDATHPMDRAIFNVRFLDNAGNPGNFITQARNFPNSRSSSRPSNWWITGNQWNYDLRIATQVRRVQDFNTANPSGFQNGLGIFINGADGTGGSNAPNSALYDSARVTGPGLPTLGLWYGRSSVSGEFALSSLRTSTAPTLASLQSNLVGCACSTYWMSRTHDVSGVGASTLRANTVTLPYTFQWAAGSDGSYNGRANLSARPVKGSVYTFEIYKNGVYVATEARTLLTDLVAATQAVNLPWNGIGPNTARALDISNTALNGAQSTLPIDWTQNPSAERIQSIDISQTDGGYDNATPFTLGATSVLATARANVGSTTFTALAGPSSTVAAPYSGFRDIDFSYRMLDGSTKNAIYSYYQ